MSAVLSADGKYRYRLDREIAAEGIVIAYFGVNPSIASAVVDDPTTRKLCEFTRLFGGRKYILGNVSAHISTDVREVVETGEINYAYLKDIISDADLLIPCWGDERKAPHLQFALVVELLVNSGKPMKVFGLTKNGSPKHPLMLGYDTQLIDGWELL